MLNLTQQQQDVIKHKEGHARVLAVAGSGKTTTLVHRVLYLLEQGIHPRRILVLMYNRAAKDDFAQKLRQAATQKGHSASLLPDVRTFHSIGHKLCQSLASWGALTERTLVKEGWPYEKLVREAISRAIESDTGVDKKKALDKDHLEAFLQFVERVKADLHEPGLQFENLELPAEQQYFIQAFYWLEEIMARQGVMTFSDLIYRPAQAIRQQPELRERISNHMDHVIVDEYQDINPIQQFLLNLLSGTRARVMVVGDVDQCIYEWRGAQPEFMLKHFSETFSPCQRYSLNYSFRYGHALSLCANHLIHVNRNRDQQMCLSPLTQSETTIKVQQQLQTLIEQDLLQAETTFSSDNAAVLVRSWSLSIPIQLAFLKAGIPFRLIQQSQFVFNQPMIEQFLNYLRLVSLSLDQPIPTEYLTSALSFPPLFLSQGEQQQIQTQVAHNGLDPDKVTQSINLKPYAARRLKKRLTLLLALQRESEAQPAGPLAARILKETDAWEQIDKAAATREQSEERKKTLQGLANYIRQQRSSVTQLLESINRQKQTGASLKDQAGVMITTVHGAKGLEWDHVILTGLTESSFPCYQNLADFSSEQEESERRLFYVALTRARKKVYLLTENGLSDSSSKKTSRFITEMRIRDSLTTADLLADCTDSEQHTEVEIAFDSPDLARNYLEKLGLRARISTPTRSIEKPSRFNPVSQVIPSYSPGDKLVHKAFGEGTLITISGEQNNRITVDFASSGRKVLLADHAPIHWIDT